MRRTFSKFNCSEGGSATTNSACSDTVEYISQTHQARDKGIGFFNGSRTRTVRLIVATAVLNALKK